MRRRVEQRLVLAVVAIAVVALLGGTAVVAAHYRAGAPVTPGRTGPTPTATSMGGPTRLESSLGVQLAVPSAWVANDYYGCGQVDDRPTILRAQGAIRVVPRVGPGGQGVRLHRRDSRQPGRADRRRRGRTGRAEWHRRGCAEPSRDRGDRREPVRRVGDHSESPRSGVRPGQHPHRDPRQRPSHWCSTTSAALPPSRPACRSTVDCPLSSIPARVRQRMLLRWRVGPAGFVAAVRSVNAWPDRSRRDSTWSC